jgi:hypothetical protein
MGPHEGWTSDGSSGTAVAPAQAWAVPESPEVNRMGRTVIAQDEATYKFFGTPAAADPTGTLDFTGLDETPLALMALVMPDGIQ